MNLFARVAAAGSFLAAAEREKRSAATLARGIGALERDLGYPLFLRGRSGVTLTEKGIALLALVAPLTGEMDLLETAARGLASAAAIQPVRITGTEPVIAEIIAPAVSGLLRDLPDLKIDLHITNALVNLTRYDAEIALRLVEPAGNSLLTRRLALFSLALYRHESLPADQAGVIGYDLSLGVTPEVRWVRDAGFEDRVRLRSSSTRTLLNAVKAGAGMAVLPDIIAESVPGLVRVEGLPRVQPKPLYMIVHRDVARRPEVRALMRWLVRLFRNA
ncbi:MAG: LysR family transcriptional regulator [Rhodobacterales bacterium]|nr:LysR family transcriptional regulator [Rhodobacterales bacterium]